MTTTPAPPGGTALRPDASLRRFAGDSVLLGGSPLRLLRLGSRGAAVVTGWLSGELLGSGAGEQRLARQLIDAGLLHPDPPPGQVADRDVTLVTPVKDHPAGTHRLWRATAELGDRVLVDDGSAEPVPGAAVRHETPRGPAAARNAGWQQVGTDVVAFVDADVQPEPGWLDPMLAQFADPLVAAVAPRVRSRAGAGAVARYEQERSGLDLGAQPAPVRPMSRVSYVPSAALVVRRSALRAVGGFDERMHFGEDVDLVWRLLDSGYAVRYEPRSVVRHDPRAGVSAWLRQRFDYGTSAAPLSARHPGRLTCAKLSGASALSWGLLAAGRPRSALATAVVTAALFPRKLRGRGLPAGQALRLAGLGHLGAGRLLAEAARRAWLPVLAVAAVFSRRARAVMLAALLPCLLDSAGRGWDWAALRVLDDLAYAAGVWRGCLRERTLDPVLPRFTEDSLR